MEWNGELDLIHAKKCSSESDIIHEPNPKKDNTAAIAIDAIPIMFTIVFRLISSGLEYKSIM